MCGRRTQPLTQFKFFTELPYDIRYQIWKELLPDPRIVYLHSYLLADSPRPCHRVWTVRPNDENGNKSFFDEDPLDKELERTDQLYLLQGAAQSRTRQKRIRALIHKREIHKIVREECNIKPYQGFKSHQPTSPLLSVCQESNYIFSQVYSRTFGASLAIPDTWFDFKRDTLFLNLWYPNPDPSLWVSKPASKLEGMYYPSDLHPCDRSKVQSLGVTYPWPQNNRREFRFDLRYWQVKLLRDFPNLKRLSFVHGECPSTQETDLVFEEEWLFKVREVCAPFYRAGYDPTSDEELVKACSSLSREIQGHQERAANDPDGLGELTESWLSRTELPLIEVRDLAYKKIATEFEMLKQGYLQEKKTWEMGTMKTDLVLHTRGKKIFRVQICDDSMSVKDIVASARKEWNIPTERACTAVFDDHYEEVCMDATMAPLVWKERHDWKITFQSRRRRCRKV